MPASHSPAKKSNAAPARGPTKKAGKAGAKSATARPSGGGGKSKANAGGGGSASKKRKAGAEPDVVQTPEADALRDLETSIETKRRALETERLRAPELRAEAVALRANASRLAACRATLREAHSRRIEADRIEAEARRIESGQERTAFETRATRYLDLARANADRERIALAPVCDTLAFVTPSNGTTTAVASVAAVAAVAAGGASTPTAVDTSGGKGAEASKVGGGGGAGMTNVALLREYRTEFEQQAPPMHIVQHDACPACGVPLLLAVNGALLTCPECRMGFPYMDATTASMAYGDEVEFISNNTKKAHHFEDRLKMFQGKGSKRVTPEVLRKVMAWHVAHDIIDVDDITTTTVRMALKANGLKDQYDYEMYIWCRITGKPAPTLGPSRESQCRNMFMRIQAPYAKWKARINPTRINFLSYGYVLYKIFQLLAWDEYLPYFTLLKGRDKLEKQEAIWRGICRDVNWDFIPAPAIPLAFGRPLVSTASPTTFTPPVAAIQPPVESVSVDLPPPPNFVQPPIIAEEAANRLNPDIRDAASAPENGIAGIGGTNGGVVETRILPCEEPVVGTTNAEKTACTEATTVFPDASGTSDKETMGAVPGAEAGGVSPPSAQTPCATTERPASSCATLSTTETVDVVVEVSVAAKKAVGTGVRCATLSKAASLRSKALSVAPIRVPTMLGRAMAVVRTSRNGSRTAIAAGNWHAQRLDRRVQASR